VDVILADDTVLIPDVVIGRRDAFGERGLEGPPTLAIGVISRSSRLMDTRLKPARLAEAGCPNYWVIDSNLPELRCFLLGADGYVETVVATGEQVVEIADPYSVRLSAESLVAPYPE
jgi:Uma2 family endonuclease